MSASEAIPPSCDPSKIPGAGEPGAEDTADVCSAAEALRRARAELKKAQTAYEGVCRRAAQQVEAVRKTTVGDVIDGTLDQIRKHPGLGVIMAALTGFFLGRLFRR